MGRCDRVTCPSCPKMRTEPKSRILEALSKFAEASRRGTGSAIGDPEQSSPSDHSFRSAGAPELLCSVAVVIAEQAAQSLTTSHLPVGTTDAFFRFEQRVPEPLMVALSVIMMDELSDGTAQRWLTEEDHPLQALAVPSIYSSARTELDRSPVCRDYACMISSFVRAQPLAPPQTQTLSY